MADNTNSEQNIRQEYNNATTGLNLDQSINQIPKGKLTYALNASVENFDANSVSYQNEPGNEWCLTFPDGYVDIGNHFIQERNKHLFFLANPSTGDSEIGYMDNNDCVYRTLKNAKCLNFSVDHPIHKVFHRITNCSTEVYWTDAFNPRRFLDIENIPLVLAPNSQLCDPAYTTDLDCNQLKLQPNFTIPQLDIIDITTGGDLTAGDYQFAIQYSDPSGNPFTSYYSVTNPTPIADPHVTTPNFNYQVGKSIVVNISNLDVTGQFQYFNLAVIKTINDVPTPELVGTYFIDTNTKTITYTGQNQTQIRLTMADIFEKFPYYEIADDLTAAQDVLIWKGMTSIDRINYQQIATNITLNWETWRIPDTENYTDELNATNLRGYLRDEIYAFEVCFLLANGKQTDGFHIPGRIMDGNEAYPDVQDTNPDFIGDGTSAPYWKIYNTASVTGYSPEYDGTDPLYKGPYQYGKFAYWESLETYPCNVEVWGDLADQPIRHHKFPDVLVSPITEPSIVFDGPTNMVMQNDTIFPMGVKIDIQQIKQLISTSNLTDSQKADIVGFKIIRGNRGTNKSIIAKGIIRNTGEYERDGQTFYFPNYPYNDLDTDPFLNANNNAYTQQCNSWLIYCFQGQPDGTDGEFEYIDCNNFLPVRVPMNNPDWRAGTSSYKVYEVCSIGRPIILTGRANTSPGNYDVIRIPECVQAADFWATYENFTAYMNTPPQAGRRIIRGQDAGICGIGISNVFIQVAVDANVYVNDTTTIAYDSERMPFETLPQAVVDLSEVNYFVKGRRTSLGCAAEVPLNAIDDASRKRLIFNSPETSFGQPFLGGVLKLENVMFGAGKAHFVEVKKNAKYKLLSKEAQQDALDSAKDIASITTAFNAGAMFTVYQAYLTIYVNGITRKNYAYSFNSIANYDYNVSIPNGLGIKQRQLDYKQYLIPAVQSVGDPNGISINNYQRESSVFLKTTENYPALPFPSDSMNIIPLGVKEHSRFTISESGMCNSPGKEQPISVVSYYGSMKNIFLNQWGQIYSYDTIDTGFQRDITPIEGSTTGTIFGGDTFITRFAFKTKLPFFIDNRVGAPDDSDIFYDEIGNVAYPKYWHSSRSILDNYGPITGGSILSNIISYKAHNFDCPSDPSLYPGWPDNKGGVAGTKRTFYDGYFYLFAYGVPNFYCETSYNVDLRQAYDNRAGDFWPHVTNGIPDDWVQESYVSIANDNTYTYNITYSKQNRENTFTHLPQDWSEDSCFTKYPFRAIYSDVQITDADNRVNSWLTYRATSYFDFPQNYGPLTAIDGIQNKAILARFENKTLLYNNLLTIDTSNPQAAYLGNPNLFKGAPPIDFAETDLGYVGSQNKFLLKIPEGQITIDAKRGQVFLITGTQATDLSGFGSGMQRFFTDHLAFEILRYFPEYPIDNHFNGMGLHGVYDSKFDRVIITKLDYIPLDDTVKYDMDLNEFYVEHTINGTVFRTQIYMTDKEYFCNKSWTLSFNMNTKSWTSFHTYIPNWYIGENNFFYSGINNCCSDLDANFQILAGDMKYERTTTTTTLAPATTTTTSTRAPKIDCELEGEAIITDCELEGTAVITVPASTTTTICQRPANLLVNYLYTGYKIGESASVDTFGSFDEACAGLNVFQSGALNFVKHGMSVNVYDLNYIENGMIIPPIPSIQVGQLIYADSNATDCTFIEDGWYFVDESLTPTDGNTLYLNVFHIVNGYVVEVASCECGTTTSTTTLPPTVNECCGVLIASGDNIYLYNVGINMNLLNVPGYVENYGIAMTANYLWSVDDDFFYKWDISLNPFTATPNYPVGLPSGFTISAGFVALNDDYLIAVDNSTFPFENVVEMNVSGSGDAVPTIKFALQENRTAHGNMLITTSGKYIIINEDTLTNEYFITQYDYATGTIELDLSIGDVQANSLYECECTLYFSDASGATYMIDNEIPYSQIIVAPLDINPTSATQVRTCVPSSITDAGDITTTTTSTTTL